MRRIISICLALVILSQVETAHAVRKIRFPDKSVGNLSIRSKETTDYGYETFADVYSGWEDHGPAAGEVMIPEGFAVRLELNRAAANDLDWVSDVPVDSIIAVESYGIPLGDAGFDKISRLTGLRRLSLSDAELTSAIATYLPRLRHLQSLWLGSNAAIDDEAMSTVAELPELESIGVYQTGVTDAGFETLSRSRSIRAVYAGRTRITDAGLAALTQLSDLRAVRLIATDPEFRGEEPNPSITDAGLTHLQKCPNLEHLDLSGSALTDEGLKRLAADCPRLRRLSIDNTALTTQGLRHIGSFSELEQLRCYGTSIDDTVAVQFRSLDKLREIVGDVEVGNSGAKALAALPRLEKLSLSSGTGGPPPDDECMASIAAMPSLKELSIQHTRITDEGFALLAGSPTIEHVQITGNRMTTRCLETLATIPKLRRVGLMSIDPRADGEPIWKDLEELRSLEKELWLCSCPPIESDDFAKFADFRNLAWLRIDGERPVTDADLQHLRQLSQLEYLEITSSVVTDEGLKVLGSLQGLERLQINCLASQKGLETLAQAPRLRYLTIGSPNLTDASVSQVQTEFPNLAPIERTEFRLGGSTVSRSKSASDDFWRKGNEEEREELNALEGKPAPALKVNGWINADHDSTLEDYRGKVILVEFWGTWCGPCRARMPTVRRLHEQYSDRGLVVIGVHSTKAAEDAAEYIESNKIPWTIATDDDKQTATAYSVPYWPSFYLIDRKGLLRMANPFDGDLEAAIEALLNE